MSIKLSGPEFKSALANFQTPSCQFDHLVFGSGDDLDSLRVRGVSAGGLNALRSKLQASNASEVLFALLRVQQKTLFITSIGQDVGGVRRAQALVQSRALQTAVGINFFGSATISDAADLTLALVGSKLKLEGFEQVESPQLAQDFRASFLSAKSFDWRASRSRSSAPPSPDASVEKLDVAGQVSNSVCSGLPMMADETSVLKADAHDRNYDRMSLLSTSRDSDLQAWNGKAVPFYQEKQNDGNTTYDTFFSQVTPRASLLSTSDRANRPSSSIRTRSSSTIGPRRVRSSDADTFGARSSDRGSTQYPNEQDVCRKSAERARTRADEAIREEVMRKLRHEQSALVSQSPRLTLLRSPRPSQLLPAPPPPPSAPPQVPLPPSPPSPPATLRRSLLNKAASPACRVVSLAETLIASAPHHDSYEELSEQPAPTSSPRPSESRQSLQSVQTVELWKAADMINSQPPTSPATMRSSEELGLMQIQASLRLQTVALQDRGQVCVKPKRSSVAAQDGHGNGTMTSSSSKVSTLAASLFDKELPRPPSTEQSDSVASSSALTPASSTQRDKERTHIAELKARLALAEHRARDAENLARTEIQKARQDSECLAKELGQAERQRQEATEVEAVRRAKWAREQVARDQLDAFERSRLESEETRRRATIAKQRQEQEEAARYAREMQKRKEEEAQKLKEEYERRLIVVAEREARLKAAAGEKEAQQRSLQEQQERRRMQHKAIVEFLEGKLKEVDSSGVVLSGSLNMQEDGALFWRKRWYKLTRNSLRLYKSDEDPAAGIEPLRSIGLQPHSLEVTDGLEDSMMRNSLKVVSQQSAEVETCTYFMYTDTEHESETLKTALQMIYDLKCPHRQL